MCLDKGMGLGMGTCTGFGVTFGMGLGMGMGWPIMIFFISTDCSKLGLGQM